MRIRQAMTVSLITCLIASNAWGQSGYRYGACSGSYDVFSSGPTASAGALSIPVGTPVQTGAQIKMDDCGRQMALTADGMSMVLYQDVMDERSYTGTLNAGDGVNREVTLRVGDDRNLRGALVASDPNMSVTRPLWLMLEIPTETRFEGCEDDAEEPFTPRGLTPEAAAVTQLLANQGISPPAGLGFADYLTTDATGPQSSRVRLRISGDGNLLPRPEIAAEQMDAESTYCTGDERLDPAHQIIEFKIEYADEDPFVFARQIDITTSQIVAQAEGVPSVVGDGALRSGIATAWSSLAPPVAGMTDGVVR